MKVTTVKRVRAIKRLMIVVWRHKKKRRETEAGDQVYQLTVGLPVVNDHFHVTSGCLFIRSNYLLWSGFFYSI